MPLEAVLAFAARAYGPDAHQASADLYRWYYDANPHRPAGEHAIVAVAGNGEVVGLANRLFMRWNVHGPIVTIPGISDLVTDPAHRQGGLGLRLAMRAVQGLEHALVNRVERQQLAALPRAEVPGAHGRVLGAGAAGPAARRLAVRPAPRIGRPAGAPPFLRNKNTGRVQRDHDA